MTYKEIITKVAEDTDLPDTLIDRTYKAYWRFIKDYVSSLPLKEDLTELELSKLRPNINIPSLGKLYVDVHKYNSKKESYRRYIKEANK